LWTRAPRIDRESSTTIESIVALTHNSFRKRLLAWFDSNARRLPWREQQSNPYCVWISEVMLQQTRVAAVIPYYERFLKRFPDVESLASAPEHDLLQAWAGLGYYSRARNLKKAALQIQALGAFPTGYDSIRSLAGVGDYTAAAIASIVFNLPYAAVDGNVHRVISRLANGEGETRTEAQALLDATRPGDFNQAMMELGATICLPRNPQCLICPVADLCRAREAGTQNDIPAKRKPKQIRVERTLLIIRRGENEMLFWRRPDTEKKLAGFWELPEPEQLPQAVIGETLGRFHHSITNFHNIFTITEAKIVRKPAGYAWLPINKPVDYLFSTTIRKALRILSEVSGV
jgi:A/G-specific adenine glycosylase